MRGLAAPQRLCAAEATAPTGSCSSHCAAASLTCVWFVQGLEENLREAQGAAQRLESHLKQKEKLYEDKIKVKDKERTTKCGGGGS